MIYRCLIIDDEELARELIASHLAQINNFELVASCQSAIEASNLLQNQQIDLLFLDIEMPVLKGTDFFKNLIHKPKVIFTTAYRDYAIDGFDLNAVDYLLKPISFSRFFKAIEKFKNGNVQKIQQENVQTVKPINNTIFVTKNRKKVRVSLDDIIYIESLKDYVRIYLEQESHTIKYGITAFEKELDHRFIRIHRSYIVNSQKITAYTKNDVEIGDVEIPIGEHFKKGLPSFLQ